MPLPPTDEVVFIHFIVSDYNSLNFKPRDNPDVCLAKHQLYTTLSPGQQVCANARAFLMDKV